jgi:hypothetical protein
MRPTTAFHDNVFDLNALLHPGTIFDHPRDVLADPSLSVSESASFWHPGRPTRRRSRPAPRCGRRRD